MATQETTVSARKNQENSRLATLPSQLQLQIRRYLELGDFRAAKALYDAGLESRELGEKH